MATRSHVDVSERRLRPIYDCLDNGNNKKALQEADKVLRKQKDFQCAKVLKALALLRLGRHDDSNILLQDVHAQHPTDEATLQAMAICYREVNRLDLIADMYENAHKVKPDNEEILSALFMAHVRLGDYKKQQQTAMVLHRLRPNKNPYYFWAVMSIVMQAHNADEKLAKSMFLPLAERMTLKYVKEDKIEAEAEVYMYMIILELLGKNEEALKVIQGPLGEKMTSELNYQPIKAAELLGKLERWPEMNAMYRKLLIQIPDQWQFYVEYLRSVFALIDAEWTPKQDNGIADPVDYTVDMAVDFISERFSKEGEDSRPIRGPYLAQLQLLLHQKQRKEPLVERMGTPEDLMRQYYQKFGDKPCCFLDLKMFLDLLDPVVQQTFVNELLEELGLGKVDGKFVFPSDAKVMQRHLTLLQMSRYMELQRHLSEEQKTEFVLEIVERYKDALKFGEGLLSTDFQPADTYLLLAVFLLMDDWVETAGSSGPVWQSIMLLEKGLKMSPSNFQFKVLLVRLYCIMGAFGPCANLYDSMEVKHIQNDTIGYTVHNHVGRLGHLTAACSLYGAMLRFFTVNHKDTTEYLISSYKYGSFTKIHEFVQFRDRLQNSLQYASATVERLLLDLTLETNNHNYTEQMVTYMEIDPEKDKTNWEKLQDNRHFGVLASWDKPERSMTEELQAKSFEEEKAWLKLRNLTLRSLAAAVILGKQSSSRGGDSHSNNNVGNGDKKTNMADVLQGLITQLKAHLATLTGFKPLQYPLQGPYRTRLSSYLASNSGEILLKMFDVTVYMLKLHDEGLDKLDGDLETQLETSIAAFYNDLVSRNKCGIVTGDGEDRAFHPEVVEHLALIAESLSHTTVLAGVCQRLLKPLKTAICRKAKKKKEVGTPLPQTFTHYNSLISGLEKAAHDLHMAILEVDPVFLSLDLSCLKLSDTSIKEENDADIQKEMWQKVERSYQQSAKELTDFIHNKMQYLSSLKL